MTARRPRTWTALLALLAAALGAPWVSAEEAQPIVRGTEGATAIPFSAMNAGPGRIACTAAIAHWYSLDLGVAGPGETVRATLWSDPATGEVSLLNELRDRMPVQALWCGLAGRSWATRSPVPLARRTGEPPDPIELTCAPESDRLICR
jgi:hypothetical protein